MTTRRQWRDAVRSSRLPHSVRLALLTLSENRRDAFHDDDGNLHSLSRERLARSMGIHPKNAQRAIRRARRDGWLAIHRPGQKQLGLGNEYHLLIPGEAHVCEGCWEQSQGSHFDRSQGSNTPSPEIGSQGSQSDSPQRALEDGLDRRDSSKHEQTSTENWNIKTALAAVAAVAPPGSDAHQILDEIVSHARRSRLGYLKTISEAGDLPDRVAAAVDSIRTRSDDEARSELARSLKCPHGVINGTRQLGDGTALCDSCSESSERSETLERNPS